MIFQNLSLSLGWTAPKDRLIQKNRSPFDTDTEFDFYLKIDKMIKENLIGPPFQSFELSGFR
jgi:hypothetical protein